MPPGSPIAPADDAPAADSQSASLARDAARPGVVPLGLIWTLIRTDFKVRYHGTASGFVWALLKPLTMFVVLTAVFSLVFREEPTYRIDLLIGLFLWDFFADGTKTGLTALHAKGFLLSKTRFRSWIIVVTSISNPLITIAVFSVIVLMFLNVTGRPPTATLFLLYLGYVLLMGIMIVGFSLGASVLFLRYRDLNQVWDLVIQAGFFIAPIVYPLSVVPERFHFYLYLWPPTAVIEFARMVLVDGKIPTPVAHLDLLLVTLTIAAVGITVYSRLARRAAEYL
jgi:homopolymeric O-antigen transport system permease protein